MWFWFYWDYNIDCDVGFDGTIQVYLLFVNANLHLMIVFYDKEINLGSRNIGPVKNVGHKSTCLFVWLPKVLFKIVFSSAKLLRNVFSISLDLYGFYNCQYTSIPIIFPYYHTLHSLQFSNSISSNWQLNFKTKWIAIIVIIPLISKNNFINDCANYVRIISLPHCHC